MKLARLSLSKENQEYYDLCVKDLLNFDTVASMSAYIQHGKISCLDHCLAVADISYRVACYYKLNLDKRSLIRGALLHDYFLYDWHEKGGGHRLHGFTHAKRALRNALRDFKLNQIEIDIIKKHMWPLTVVPPKYKEALLVNLVDNYCSLYETIHRK